MDESSRSPFSLAVDVLGDRWTLIVLRDIMFRDRRYFRALLTGSAERIASNILADRLKRLLDAGLLSRGPAGRGQRARFSLTETGIRALPVLCELAAWGVSSADGPGPDAELITAAAEELRRTHLDDTVVAPTPALHALSAFFTSAFVTGVDDD